MMKNIFYKTFGALGGLAFGCFFGFLVLLVQEEFGWSRDFVFLALFLGLCLPAAFFLVPIENRKIWGRINKAQHPSRHSLESVDYDFAWPPIFFFFCLGLLAIPYLYQSVEFLQKLS